MARSVSKEKNVSFDRLRKITENPSNTVHFVGVGGVSMYSLARLASLGGARISGSDKEESERTLSLREEGIDVHIGHSPEWVKGASLVVYTHAIDSDNVELCEARRLEIPVVSRAEYMGALMLGYKRRIGVSGSHGKSTTVAILDEIFSHSGGEPTVLSGADLHVGTPLKVGSRELMVYEACEYKDSFLRFAPSAAIGLNLELDHTDYFDGIGAMKESFRRALSKATDFAVINGDDDNLRSIAKLIRTKVVSYGQEENNDYTYSIKSFKRCGFVFSLSRFGSEIADFELNIPGIFNVSNAVAAIVTALEYGLDVDLIAEAVSAFTGIKRRLEHIGTRYGRDVYYDYAHHPTEIIATINALKMMTHDLVTVIFKPHTYTRTDSLWDDFKAALSSADYVIMTEIYPAREEPIEGVDSRTLAEEIGESAVFRDDGDVVGYLDSSTHGSIIIMGAGDMDEIVKGVMHDYLDL